MNNFPSTKAACCLAATDANKFFHFDNSAHTCEVSVPLCLLACLGPTQSSADWASFIRLSSSSSVSYVIVRRPHGVEIAFAASTGARRPFTEGTDEDIPDANEDEVGGR